MFRKSRKRATSILVLVAMLFAMAVPALAEGITTSLLPDGSFLDDDAPVPDYTAIWEAPAVENGKYLKVYSADTIFAAGEYGAEPELLKNIIIDGSPLFIEFNQQLTQDIRIELWSVNDAPQPEALNYLGVIAKGRAYGQWGTLGDDGTQTNYSSHTSVANVALWDGTYFDTAEQSFLFPGEENGSVETGLYTFVIRFQPTHSKTDEYTTDVVVTFDYTDGGKLKTGQLRSHEELYDVMAGDPVNVTNGNFTWDYTDIPAYNDHTLEFKRYYNSQDENESDLGFGWRHNYLIELEASNLFATVTLADGYRYQYNVTSNGIYTPSSPTDATLERTGNGEYVLTERDKTQYFFDNDGNLNTIIDVHGEMTTIARYGAQISYVANSHSELSFMYANGKISSVQRMSGPSVSFTYDGGDLVSSTNDDNDQIRYTYQNHWMTEIKDLNSTYQYMSSPYLTNTYDDIGRVTAQYLADRGTTLFSYDFGNKTTTVTPPNSYGTVYHYDAEQNLQQIDDDFYGTAMNTVHYGITDSRVTSVTNRSGNTTSYDYDDAGNIIQIAYPDGTYEVFGYNSMNLLESHQLPNSNAYGPPGFGPIILYEYNDNGKLTRFSDANGNETFYEYDFYGNLSQITDPCGNSTSFTYDIRGNLISKLDPYYNSTSYSYDSFERLSGISYPDGSSVEFTYSAAGKLITTSDSYGNEVFTGTNANGYVDFISDAMGYVTDIDYDAQNQPIRIMNPETYPMTEYEYEYDFNGNLVGLTDPMDNLSSYTYDMIGRLMQGTDARGNSWGYSYDVEGRLDHIMDPLFNSTSAYYNNMGRLESVTDSRGATTSYQYDAMGRVIRVTDATGHYERYVYDYNGNLIEYYDKNGGKWEYEYNANNQLISSTDPTLKDTVYTYNANGQLTKITDELGGHTEFMYDNMGRIVFEIDAEDNETSYEYDLLGRLIKTTYADDTYATYTYNANGWLVSATAQDGGITEYTYDTTGQVLTITNALGGVTETVYDLSGRTISTEDALGGTTAYAYDANGNVVALTDALGNTTAYVYDKLNRATSITDPLGGIMSAQYDANGNITKIINADNGEITYVYDSLNRLISYTDAEGYDFSFEYDPNGNVVAATDGNGNSIDILYDPVGRIDSQTDAAGNLTHVMYDPEGRIASVTDGRGGVTSYSYDLNGNVTQVTDALGNITAITYNEMNRVSTVTDALGAETSYSYSPTGQIATVTDALGGTVSYEYDLLGNLISETNELGETTEYTYDALSRVVSVKNALENEDHLSYDANGNITSVTDKNGNTTQYVHDANGNIVETIDALGNSSYYEYDAMNRLVEVRLYRIDEQDNVNEEQITLYEYDKRGLVTKEINAADGETIYVYDGNGNMIQKTDADGFITTYTYDPRDLVETIVYAADEKIVAFQYDENGSLIGMDDWNGTTTFGLDLLGQIISVNDHNDKLTGYTYDAVGNQTSIAYPDGTVANYEYDLLGRLTSLVDAEQQVTSYGYDAAGQLVLTQYPNGWKEYNQYDAVGQLTKVLDINPAPAGWFSQSEKSWYVYDAEGNVTQEFTRGSGLSQPQQTFTHTYDALNRLTQTCETWPFIVTNYEYDSLGNLTFESSSLFTSTDYKYNNLNQQVSKTVNGLLKYDYTFDGRGNLVKGEKDCVTFTIPIEAYVYDATNRMTLGTNEFGETSAYIYNGLGDRIGNVYVTNTNAYGFYGFGSLANPWYNGFGFPGYASYPSGGFYYPGYVAGYPGGYFGYGAYSYGYSAWGSYPTNYCGFMLAPGMWPFFGFEPPPATQTVEKSYVLDYTSLDRDVLMESENGGLTFRFNYGLDKVSSIISGPTFGDCDLYQNGKAKVYYHHDRMGSTDFITDNFFGTVISAVDFDDWGVPTFMTPFSLGMRSVDVVSEYTGHPLDPVMGVYYAKARMYDAGDRRFMAEDPVKGSVLAPQTLVEYTYVMDNPLKWVDPQGLFLRGTILREGATGENVLLLQEKLHELYMNGVLTQNINHNEYFGSIYGETTQKAVEEYILLNQSMYNFHPVPGAYNVDLNVWSSLGLSVNSTIEDEFWSGAKGGGNTTVTISGNDMVIDYYPKFYVREEYMETVNAQSSNSVIGMPITNSKTASKAVYVGETSLATEGFKAWGKGGPYYIQGVGVNVSVNVHATEAKSVGEADVIITTNNTMRPVVPSVFFPGWSTENSQIIYLNYGLNDYSTNNAKKYTATHEFGHVLGLFDAYGYEQHLGGLGEVLVTPAARIDRAPGDGVMRGTGNHDPVITATEIGMILQAWSRNKLQLYEPGGIAVNGPIARGEESQVFLW